MQPLPRQPRYRWRSRPAVSLGVAFALVLTVGGADGRASQSNSELFAVEDVRRGMTGVGYTVMEGTDPARFDVELLGVIADQFPKIDLIIARLTGLGLERSGVAAGMSGSPVFVDGKLLGAVAYRLTNFGHEAIAGIVPAGDMIALGSRPGERQIRAAPSPAAALTAAAELLVSAEASTALRAVRDQMAFRQAPGVMAIASPLSITGIQPGLVASLQPLLSELGWQVAAGGAAAGNHAVAPNLVAGGAIGVQLVRGDINITATGTITHVADGRVYAFGHPFMQGGDVDFPMVAAEVVTLLSSANASSKLSIVGTETLGAVRQDRLPAIMGVVGAVPKMVPVRARIEHGEHGRVDDLRFEIVSDGLLTPLYLFFGMVNAVQSLDSVYGRGSIEFSARFGLPEGVEDVTFETLYSSQNQAVIGLASNLAGLFAGLYDNPIRPLDVRDVDLDLRLRPDVRSATIVGAHADRVAVKPGERIRVNVVLEPYRSERVTRSVEIVLPDSLQPGPLTLIVGDAASTASNAAREANLAANARTVDELVRRLNDFRRSDRVYLQASRQAAGAVVNGAPMPSLRGSLLDLLASPISAGDVQRTDTAILAESSTDVGFVVSGVQRLELRVEPR